MGGVLIVMGLFLFGMMAVIIGMLAPTMLNPGESQNGTRFTGTPEDAKLIFGILGLVAALGVGFAISGLWQVVSGRRSKVVAFVALGILWAIVIGSWILEIYTEWL